MTDPETRRLRGGQLMTLRPIAATDGAALHRLVVALPPRERRWRFHCPVNDLSAERLEALIRPPAGCSALVATVAGQVVADLRFAVDDTGDGAEFALMVDATWRRQGIARLCVDVLVEACAERELRWLHGTVMADNAPMLALMKHCGFHCTRSREDPELIVVERRTRVPAAAH